MSGFDEMPPSWAEVPFDDAVEVISDRGIRIKQKDYLEAGAVPVIDQGDGLVGGYTDHRDAKIEAPLPLFVFGDHTRRFKFVSFTFAVGADGVKLFAPNELWEPRFLFYQLETVDLENRGYGRHYQYLRKESLRLPPSREQARIVEKLEELLSDLDAGVTELKAAQRKLAQYRQSLLKAAVEGALTADWRAGRRESEKPPRSSSRRKPGSSALANPKSQSLDPGFRRDDGNSETGTDLLQRILTERRTRWETKQLAKFIEQGKTPPKDWKAKYPEPATPDGTELSPLPKGWAWATVDQLSVAQKYGSSAKTSENSTGIPVLRMGNIQDGELNIRVLKYLPQTHDEFPDLFLEDGDILFNRTNSPELVGKTAVFRSQINPCSYASYLISVKLSLHCSPEFVSAYINSAFGRQWVKAVVTQQVGQANVNGTKLAALAVPLPPADEQAEITKLLVEQRQAAFDQETMVDRSLKQSAAQRKNILKAAFAGQLVPQDPNDEPASVLLERIRAERATSGTMGTKHGRKTTRKVTKETR